MEEARGIVVDRPDAVAGEQLGEDPGHDPAVLDHVGDAGRRAEVVLQNHIPAVGTPEDVDTGDVDPNPVGRIEIRRLPEEVRRTGDQPAGHEPLGQDLLRAVDVGQEGLESPHPLADPVFEDGPFLGGDDPGQQVERDGPLLAREGEGDALVPQRAVAQGATFGEIVDAQGGQRAVERGVARAKPAGGVEHLVPCRSGGVVLEEIAHQPDCTRFRWWVISLLFPIHETPCASCSRKEAERCPSDDRHRGDDRLTQPTTSMLVVDCRSAPRGTSTSCSAGPGGRRTGPHASFTHGLVRRAETHLQPPTTWRFIPCPPHSSRVPPIGCPTSRSP